MSENGTVMHDKCPNCGRSLKLDASGRIGFCTHHKKWFPVIAGSESEAARKNAEEESLARKAILDREREDNERKEAQRALEHKAVVRKLSYVAIAFILVLFAVVFLIVRPSITYNRAQALLDSGDFYSAFRRFSGLGSYKDSHEKAIICESLALLLQGETDGCFQVLEQSINDKNEETISLVRGYLIPVLSNWQEYSIEPLQVLRVIEFLNEFGIQDQQDLSDLFIVAHVALEDDVISYMTADVTNDGNDDLIVLYQNFEISVLRMSSTENYKLAVNNHTTASCYVLIAGESSDDNPDLSINCYSKAYSLVPDEANRNLLTSAYNRRAEQYKAEGELDKSVDDEYEALLISGTISQFNRYYATVHELCTYGVDYPTAIKKWHEFADSASADIRKFGAEQQWKHDAAILDVSYAVQLASQNSADCLKYFESASLLGLQINDEIDTAISIFDYGLIKARLLLLAIAISSDDGTRVSTLNGQLSECVGTSLREWKERGIPASEIPVLIKIADENSLSVGIDSGAVYREAALISAGSYSSFIFGKWDSLHSTDKYEQLLVVDRNGILRLMGIEGYSWTVMSQVDTGLIKSSLVLSNDSVPIFAVISGEKDSFMCIACENNQLEVLFSEKGITGFKENPNGSVTFARSLPGSIYREVQYRYVPSDNKALPQVVSLEWQKNNYPYPDNAEDTLLRYFEAFFYGIDDEVTLLSSSSKNADSGLTFVPAVPDSITALSITPFCVLEDEVVFGLEYTSNGILKNVVATVMKSSTWGVAGFSVSPATLNLPVITLNSVSEGLIQTKNAEEDYFILVPVSGCLKILWQAGDKDTSRSAFMISLYKESVSSSPMVSYELQPSLSLQQTEPIFISPGVYYVVIKVLTGDAIPYSITMQFEPSDHVELEVNDTPQQATPIQPDTVYSGSLLSSGDIDYYSFMLTQPEGINIQFKTSGGGRSTSAFAVDVFNLDTGVKVGSITVPGNTLISESGNMYLNKGMYVIRVSKGTTWNGDTYSITANTVHVDMAEKEYNDTPEKANAVGVNKSIQGSFPVSGDVDCFVFDLTQDSVVQLQYFFLPTGTASKTYVLTIMDDNSTELQRVNVGGKESSKICPSIVLKKGRYYVKVENTLFVNQDYSLIIAAQPVDLGEKENNDIPARSTNLNVGETITGVLSSDTDIDYFRISVSEEVVVSLKFRFPQSSSKSNVFSVGIEENGKTVLSLKAKGESGGMEQQIQFPAGEYYIKVKTASEWDNSVYTLRLQQ